MKYYFLNRYTLAGHDHRQARSGLVILKRQQKSRTCKHKNALIHYLTLILFKEYSENISLIYQKTLSSAIT